MDEQAYLQTVRYRLARELGSHEQRIARACFEHELSVEEVVKMLRSRLSFINRTKGRARSC